MDASILHADLDAFYASVEQRDRPELVGKPVIVGGGVVLACSYEAKARGVRTAMGGAEARRLCPDAVMIEPRMEAYATASRAVFEVFDDTTPLVEGLSIDEAFLDVSGLRRLVGTPVEIAQGLRTAVLDKVGLVITVGIARTKFLAKVASGVAKPDGLLVVEPSEELEFLHPLRVERLWGVGPVTAAKLAEHGIATVGEVAAIPESVLIGILGQAPGRHLHALAHNRDPRPVLVGRRRKSVGAQRAIGRGPHSAEFVNGALLGLVDRITRRLRSGDRVARTIVLSLRFGDFSRATRSRTLVEATAETAPILSTAQELLEGAGPLIAERGLTLVGVAASNLADASQVQMALPFEPRDRAALDGAVDEVRSRFGTGSLTRAALLDLKPGVSVPILPDVIPD